MLSSELSRHGIRNGMQWILQQFEDTQKLADALDRLGISYSWHKVVPFIGTLEPEPEVRDPQAVVMFGSYMRSAEWQDYLWHMSI
jgi:hypothetical protein